MNDSHSRGRPFPEPGCKVSVYFPEHIIGDIVTEADRLDRSISWVVQRCVRSGGLKAVRSIMPDSEAAE